MIFQEELIKSLQIHAERTAIETGSEHITYAALLDITDRITRFLLRKQLPKETVIGIQLQNRADIISSIIGIANARCVFVPIDPLLPQKRLEAMLNDLSLHHSISSRSLKQADAVTANAFITTYFIEDILAETEASSEEIEYPKYEADDSLYIYFTSGTTGTPKGIVGRNCSLLQFVNWEISEFSLNQGTKVSQFISPYFDACLRDVFVPLLCGGTICIPPANDDFFTPEKIGEWIDSKRINVIHCVPSVFRIINNGPLQPGMFQNLQYIFLSGEKIIPSGLAAWYGIFGTGIQLVNFYGATETTMIRAFYKINPDDVRQARIPIGSPIYDTELLIAREDMKPCGVLMPGDLYIVSKYVSKGYLNAPAITAAKFIKLNAGTDNETIAFRTGDKARRLVNGLVDLIGREDRQVKLRGIRIELDEIENVLARAGFVKNAVVIKHAAENGEESLISFVIKQEPLPDAQDISAAVKEHLKHHLPEYMIPAAVIEVKEYPLLSNGKINYQELLNCLNTTTIVEPATELEKKVLSLWKDILGNKPISVEESFHSMGGNSISIMRLIGKLYKEFNVRISLNDVFDNLTIRKQAALIEGSGRDNLLTISKAAPKDGYNLSAAQERIYYNYEMNRQSTAFNLPMAWEMENGIDKPKVAQALQQLVERHESLRTEFKFVNGKLLQVVKEKVDFIIDEIKEHDVSKAIANFIRPFDLANAPLIRCGIVCDTQGKKILILDIHHIVCDGMSQISLLADFLAFYNGEQLAPLPIGYKDYAEWEYNFRNTDDYLSHRQFWLKAFEGEIPSLELPVVDLPADASDEGANMFFTIEKPVIDPVLKMLNEEGITTFSGLFSMFYLFLSQLTGQEDIVIGINTSGRMQDELNGVVGMFTKTLPIRYEAAMDLSFKTMVKEVHKRLVQANSKQVYDLSDILAELNNNRATPVKSLFDVMFVLQNFEDKAAQSRNDGFFSYDFENNTSKFPITLFATESEDGFNFRMEYLSNYFTKADAGLLVTQFKSLAKKIAQNVNGKLSEYLAQATQPVQFAEDNISFNF